MTPLPSQNWVCAIAVGALVLTGCASHPVGPGGTAREESSDPAPAVVQALVDAFSRHDPVAMAALVTEDFEYLSVNGETVSMDAKGRDALRQSMEGYFKSFPDVRSVIEHATVTGPYVAFRERVAWTAKSGPKSQASLGVYEVHEGLIRRVWYFPAVERSDTPPAR